MLNKDDFNKVGYKQYSLICTDTNMTTIRAVAMPYQTLDGAWRMKFNGVFLYSGGPTGGTISIVGIVFKNVTNYYQAPALTMDGVMTFRAYCSPNGNGIGWNTGSALTQVRISGDVELECKPDFVQE